MKSTNNVKDQISNAVTWEMNDKLEGFASLSTSPLCNDNCIKRMEAGDTVCAHCFSARMNKRFKNLAAKLKRNAELLSTVDIQPEDVPFLNRAFFRFEAFGDLLNTQHFKNLCTIAEANPHTTFALWTKNPWIIPEALAEFGISKPENMIIVQSSVLLNQETTPANEYIDKVFTVYDKKHAESVNINCGGRKCAECLRCYTKSDEIEYIAELLK